MTDDLPKTTLKQWLGLLVLWTVPALPLVLHHSVRPGEPDGALLFMKPDQWRVIVASLLYWYVWLPLTPTIVRLGRRFPLFADASLCWRHVALHVVLGFGLSLFCEMARTAGSVLLFDVDPQLHLLLQYPFGLFLDIWGKSFLYWIILLAAQGWRDYWQGHEHRRQLTEARLAALKSQIHPHFLFNTLHSISTLVEEDAAAARTTIAKLGELLRASLDESPDSEVTLDEELALVRLYLDIEQVRFADRLEVHYEIAPDTRFAAVPPLLLQPLVENAVRHGIGGRSAAGLIRIRSERDQDRLRIDVEDDGPGPAGGAGRNAKIEPGIGLANSRNRLAELYGDAASLELEARTGGGCRCSLRLPLRSMKDAA